MIDCLQETIISSLARSFKRQEGLGVFVLEKHTAGVEIFLTASILSFYNRPMKIWVRVQRDSWVAGIFFLLVGIALYAITVRYDYCLDDNGSIIGNYLVKGGVRNIGTIFSTEYRYGTERAHTAGILYRPLTLSFFALEQQVAPNKPWFFHSVNVLLYGLTGWLLWAVWRRILIGFSALLPFLSVLFFLAHPIHTEVVANIKSLDEMLGLYFGTLALYALWRYLEKEKALWLVGATIAFAAAVFSKENSLIFLAIYPLTLWFFSEKSIREILKLCIWFLVPAALFLSVRAWVIYGQGEQEIISGVTNVVVIAPTMLSKAATAFSLAWRYLAVLVIPHPLVSDMSYPQVRPVGFSDPRALAGLALLTGMAVLGLAGLKNRRFPAFASLFFLISFAPVSNLFILIGTNYAERALYTPSLAFALLLSWMLGKASIGGSQGKWLQWVGVLIAGAILILFTAKTFSRVPDWKDYSTLSQKDILTSPNSFLLSRNYGAQCFYDSFDPKNGALVKPQLLQKSIDLFTKAIELCPSLTDVLDSRADAYSALFKLDLAIADYEKSLAINPKNPTSMGRLGALYMDFRNQKEKAEELFRKALSLDPRFSETRLRLGRVLKQQKKYDEAIAQWEEGLKYSPENIALHRMIGETYVEMGKMSLGMEYLNKVKQFESKSEKGMIR